MKPVVAITWRYLVAALVAFAFHQSIAADRVRFSRQRLFPGYDGKTCKVQPSVATDGRGTVLLTWQNLLLSGSDVFYGESMSRSSDGGKTFSPGVPIDVLKDTWDGAIRTARYANVYYSKRNGRWFGLGAGQLFANDAEPMSGLSNGNPTLFPIVCTVDPEKGTYTSVRRFDMPAPYSRALPFGQILEDDDGSLLIPFYVSPAEGSQKSYCQIMRCHLTGDGIELVKAGTPIADDRYPRGVCEPSLAKLGSKYYVTLRSDLEGLWAESDDGLAFSGLHPWVWDDGTPIGNYNTQQHWLRPSGALYLAYTRKTPYNGHVFRHRAPIFMSKFDPVRGCLVRSTESVLIPELGARLGNFNVIDPTEDESWLVTAEWMQSWRGARCENFGSDNSLWLARVRFQVEDPAKTRGTLCLAFDDTHNFETWKNALPLFEKYGARATFFFNGKIDGKVLEAMNLLQGKGHSIGFHGVAHAPASKLLKELGEEGYLKAEILPQIEAAKAEGYDVQSFAYPFSNYDSTTERVLAKHFKRRRTDCIWNRDPAVRPLASCDELYHSQNEFAGLSLLKAHGIGSDVAGIDADVAGGVRRLAERDEAMVLCSHKIVIDGRKSPSHMAWQTLETILRTAKECGVRVIGFDEIGK